MRRPRVALTTSASRTAESLAARERYVRALRDAGAEVLVCEPGAATAGDVAAVCLSGGGDIEPSRYGAADIAGVCENVVPERDELELRMTRDALATDVPVLGICRGFQLLNVALGGSLAMHVDGHQAKGDAVITHEVAVAAGSLLAKACGAPALRVNSRHHQAVTADRLAPALRATAFHDGLVEAFESPSHRWVIGVQWHPERSGEVDEHAARIFDAFVAAASRAPIRP